jgi:hypothetical protein
MKRRVIPELLDTDAGTPREIAAAVNDLGRVNRWFGGVRTTDVLLRRATERTGKRELSLLDVAAGSGELPAAVRSRFIQNGVCITITLLDRAPTHLKGAVNAVVGDALATPFRDQQFDLVSSSLFVHHLQPAEVVSFVNESLRVARLAVIINDLRRSRLHLMATYAGWVVFRSRLSRHDGPASVRRAYTVAELRVLLGQTQASRVEITKHFLFRIGAILWK